MIISHRHKFIFFACGKTGTHSVESIMEKYHDGEEIILKVDQELEKLRRQYSKPFTLKHVRPAFVRDLIDPGIWNNYFKFVFVRNPWDWVLSNYSFNHKHLAQFVYRFDPVHVEVVWNLMKIHNQSLYTESYYQHTFVVDQNGERLVDYFGKMENFQEDFNQICSKIGIETEILEKRNPSDHSHYREIYSEEAKNLVSKLYREDIEILGYSF